MREGSAALAGMLVAAGFVVAFGGVPPIRSLPRPPHLAAARRRLAADLERAGWRETPERLAVLLVAGSACASVVLGALSPLLAPVGLVAVLAGCLVVLTGAIERRRRRLEGELVPLLELFTLELSAGGSPLSALGSVSVQVESELAGDLRRMLISSQVSGSASFESRLLGYSEFIRIPALATLATILVASREFGTGATPGVRALATDLRRGQRRELIAHSRRALNHVLLPAGVCVLLPFLAVLMFPAVSVLQRSLR